jgi:hypothetical protein
MPPSPLTCGVGEIHDAVVAHAPGELERGVLLRGSIVVRRGSGVVVTVTATIAVEGESRTTAQQHHDGEPRGGEASAAQDPTPARRPVLVLVFLVVIGRGRLILCLIHG